MALVLVLMDTLEPLVKLMNATVPIVKMEPVSVLQEQQAVIAILVTWETNVTLTRAL